MTEAKLEKPIWVQLNDDFNRDKLTLGSRSWIKNDDTTTPRKGIIYKGRVYRVEAADHVIQHFLDGFDLLRVDQKEKNKSMTEKLKQLPYVGDSLAEQIAGDYTDYKEFRDNVDITYLITLNGVGHSKAEEILENIRE